MRRRGYVICEPISREVQCVDGRDDIDTIEASILVSGVAVVSAKFRGLSHALRKEGTSAIFESEEFAPGGRVRACVVFLNEAPGAANRVEAQQFSPIIGIFAFFECRERANGRLMTPYEFCLTQIFQEALGTNPEVFVLGHNEPELIRQIDVCLVVGSGGKQNAFAFVFLDVFLDSPIALSLAIAEILTFIDQDHAVATQLLQLADDSRKRQHLREKAVFGDVVLPHPSQVLRTNDQRFSELIVLQRLRLDFAKNANFLNRRQRCHRPARRSKC